MPDTYCPGWIYDAVTSEIAAKFLAESSSLQALAQKYSRGLSSLYFPIEAVELAAVGEEMLIFLSEIEANELAFEYLSGFGYYRINFVSTKTRRNLSPTFGDIEEGERKRQYSGGQSLKGFRAYVFSRRSDVGVAYSPGWSLASQHELKTLSKISKELVDTGAITINHT